ncbi:MAG: DEAD/DEAH box helicase family protein [Clostridiales Family XIII bacterium]|jgi:type III restriction enzyme|nr:DEAD/DEAH box helicase family protein [Clostridiales Family XIII bacterium]
MELKKYQKAVIADLTDYLALLPDMSAGTAFTRFWEGRGIGLEVYHDTLGGVPNVCVKVPTGGGKTFIAASAIAPIFESLPHTKTKAVVWLVPSDSILEQTLANLKNPYHPYNEHLRRDFHTAVYEKSELLNGQNFSPAAVTQQLSVLVLSYDSFRTSKKDGRKAYQENGNLAAFADYFGDKSLLLADTDETALINVIRRLNPVIIVDESHHAVSALSREMLANFNPSFVLDLTATPKTDANIISYVDALQLKRENMVKLPVIVYNMRTKAEVVGEAIYVRRKLETEAAAERGRTGRYIRPIALFQAEPKGKADNTTFEKLKKDLIDAGVPKTHIAIKTADVNELRGVDLLGEGCPIRYIITVNALKEGWDCPFAYILATVANRSSAVDVEQILGRVLRLPNTAKSAANTLNISYCLTSSASFHETLEKVVAGLQSAGFSSKDCRAVDNTLDASTDVQPLAPVQQAIAGTQETDGAGEPLDIAAIRAHIEGRENTGNTVPDTPAAPDLFAQAEQAAQAYDNYIGQQGENVPIAAGVREKMNEFHIAGEFAGEAKELRLPQFVIPFDIPLFTDDTHKLLAEEDLTVGFTLKNKDATIDFQSIDAEIARVDIEGNALAAPKAWKLSGADNEFFREWFNSLPTEKRIAECKGIICNYLDKNNALSGVAEYVDAVIGTLTAEQLDDLQQSPFSYATKIRKKIDALLLTHREGKFKLWREQGKITVEPRYSFPKTIAPLRFAQTIPNSLYTAEEDMNGLEKDVVWAVANLPNVRWWHRNASKTGFCVNGFENAYPDVIVMTESGKLLLLETKGDHLENAESERKCRIGREWANLAGADCRYYMVFRDKDLRWDGAVRFDGLIDIVKGL